MMEQFDVSERRMCRALSQPRSTQRYLPGIRDGEELLIKRMIELATKYGRYGYRRITALLQREGFKVNHKRVLRLMREDNLLSLRRRAFVATTDSNHDHQIYANLVPGLEITGINQLWVADITYIRLYSEWIYLAVVLDAYSRRCIGWALDRTLEADLAIRALKSALTSRPVQPGLVHHSDRGVQYASNTYVGTLNKAGINISMSRRGNPYDNAKAESFIKTLKYEEVYLYEYESLEEAKFRIGYFIDTLYNQKRLHSSLDYRPPAEFEQELADQITVA